MDPSKVRKSKAVTARLNSIFALLTTGLSGVGALVVFALTDSLLAAGSWVAVAIVLTLVGQRALWEGIAGPVRLTLEAVQKIAQGDFDARLTPEDLGYLSDYSETLNALCETQQRISEGVSDVVGRLQEVPERIFEAIAGDRGRPRIHRGGRRGNRLPAGEHQYLDPRHQRRGREPLSRHRRSLLFDPRDGRLHR